MYDEKFDCFKKDSPHEIMITREPNHIQFREVKVPPELGGDGTKEVKLKLLEELSKKFKSQIGDDFDLVGEFKKSSPPNLVEYHKNFGIMFLAIGKCLFIFGQKRLFDLLNGRTYECNSHY
jgi:hypothetical protein